MKKLIIALPLALLLSNSSSIALTAIQIKGIKNEIELLLETPSDRWTQALANGVLERIAALEKAKAESVATVQYRKQLAQKQTAVGQIRQGQAEKAKLQSEKADLEDSLATMQAILVSAQEESDKLAKREDQAAALAFQIDQQRNALNQQYLALDQNYRGYANANAAERDRLYAQLDLQAQQFEKAAAEYNAQLTAYEDGANDLKKQIADQEGFIDQQNEELAELRRQSANPAQISALQARITKLEGSYQKVRKQNNSLQRQLIENQKAAAENAQRYAAAQANVRKALADRRAQAQKPAIPATSAGSTQGASAGSGAGKPPLIDSNVVDAMFQEQLAGLEQVNRADAQDAVNRIDAVLKFLRAYENDLARLGLVGLNKAFKQGEISDWAAKANELQALVSKAAAPAKATALKQVLELLDQIKANIQRASLQINPKAKAAEAAASGGSAVSTQGASAGLGARSEKKEIAERAVSTMNPTQLYKEAVRIERLPQDSDAEMSAFIQEVNTLYHTLTLDFRQLPGIGQTYLLLEKKQESGENLESIYSTASVLLNAIKDAVAKKINPNDLRLINS